MVLVVLVVVVAVVVTFWHPGDRALCVECPLRTLGPRERVSAGGVVVPQAVGRDLLSWRTHFAR